MKYMVCAVKWHTGDYVILDNEVHYFERFIRVDLFENKNLAMDEIKRLSILNVTTQYVIFEIWN
jgi:hypothetical protein